MIDSLLGTRRTSSATPFSIDSQQLGRGAHCLSLGCLVECSAGNRFDGFSERRHGGWVQKAA
jgi:hypothetical protein